MDDQKREITAAVATRIRSFRKKAAMSQEELALKANLNPAYFGQVERGLKCPTAVRQSVKIHLFDQPDDLHLRTAQHQGDLREPGPLPKLPGQKGDLI